MKSTIGLLVIGLIIRNGLADVSHLAKPGHNHYLPPPIQDLPVDQDYNGIDSHPSNGAVHNSDNERGYLPPYQGGHGRGQYEDNYDHNVEVSYNDDFVVQQPQGQGIEDQAHGGHDDDDHEDHVAIDHQLLEPIFPSNFPVQGYYAPNGESQRQVKPIRGEAHSISLVHYNHKPSPLSSPAPFTLSQTPKTLPHAGYDYPRPTKSADFLYSNENPGASSDLSEPGSVEDEEEEHEQGEAGPQRGYLPPPSNYQSQVSSHAGHHNSRPQQDHYQSPVQSSHGAHHQSVGHSHGGSQQDYLSPVQSNLDQLQQERGYLPPVRSTHQQSAGHGHEGSQQDYLAPVQSSHGAHQQSVEDHPEGSQQDYLPPVQSNLEQLERERGYLPPVQSGHGGHHNHHGSQQDYLSPLQSNLGHQGSQQDYLSPVQSNLGQQGSQQEYLSPVQTHQHSHSNSGHLNRGYLPPSQASQAGGSGSHSNHHHQHQSRAQQVLNTNTLEQDYLSPGQSNEVHHSGHIQPTQSILGVSPPSLHSHHEHEQNYLTSTNSPSALQLVAGPQLDVRSEHPSSNGEEENGHINVPLPIPQVGYFFIPGIVSKLPSLTETQTKNLKPALNIPGIISPEPTKSRPTQRFTSPEYTRAFLLQKKKQQQKTSSIVITPSVQTMNHYQSLNQLHPHQHESPEGQDHADIDYPSPQQNLNTHVNFLQQSNDNRQYLPPHDQSQDHPSHEQGAIHESTPNRGAHAHTSANQVVNPNSYQGRGYLPPVNNVQDQHHQHSHQDHHHHVEEDHQQHHQHSNQAQDHHQHVQEDHHHHYQNQATNSPQKQRHTYHQESIVRGYLPPDNQNQITSLKTYMKGVHPSDRYGSSHYQQPPQAEKGNPPPPVGTAPPMYSNPAAIKAYAPGMAYRVPNNAPFSTFTPASYLPPVENPLPSEDDQDNSLPIGLQLNEEAKRNLASVMPKDNTLFPLDALLNIADNELDAPELMAQQRGRIRTVQIIDNHANTAKTFRVLETADHKGVKTIKILGHAGEDPMGEHKVIRIISQGPHPGGFHQTVKIFADHKEVTLPTTNAYLPPPKAKETLVRVLRNSQNELRSH